MTIDSDESDRLAQDLEQPPKPRLTIFRSADACDMRISGAVTYSNLNETMLATLGRIQDAGGEEGSKAEHVFSAAGMSLGRVWFKSGFPLLLHSHDSDCLYYITAGSLQLGTVTLEEGDGFFVPSNATYSYTAGPEGVELLEFRTSEGYDFKMASRNPKYYDQLMSIMASRRSTWQHEERPGRIRAPSADRAKQPVAHSRRRAVRNAL